MKKEYLIIAIILIIVTIIGITLSNTKRVTIKNKNKDIAVYVYDDSEGNYVKANDIPSGEYTLNTTLSHCLYGSTITSYNSTSGTVTTNMTTSDKCYYYFDIHSPYVYWNDNYSDTFYNTGSLPSASNLEESGYNLSASPYIKSLSDGSAHKAICINDGTYEACFNACETVDGRYCANYWNSSTSQYELLDSQYTNNGLTITTSGSSRISISTTEFSCYISGSASNSHVYCAGPTTSIFVPPKTTIYRVPYCYIYSNGQAKCFGSSGGAGE